MFSRKRAGVAIVASIGLIGVLFSGASSASAAPKVTKPTIGSNVCPANMELFGVTHLTNKGKKGPATLNVFWNKNRTKVCATVTHVGKAYGKKAKTSITIQKLEGGKVVTDEGQFFYYAGPATISVKKCLSIKSSMDWNGKTYTYDEPAACTPGKAPSKTDPPATKANWNALAQCESGNKNDKVGPYYGYFGMAERVWRDAGGKGLPSDHSRSEQLKVLKKLQKSAGWSQWPQCSKKLTVSAS